MLVAGEIIPDVRRMWSEAIDGGDGRTWNPLINLSDAIEVAGRLRSKFTLVLTAPVGSAFWHAAFQRKNHTVAAEFEAVNPATAISEAMLVLAMWEKL